MKKLLVTLLGAVLLLTGCGAEPIDPDATTAETQLVGYYTAGSALEKATDGAVYAYQLPRDEYTKLAGVGDRILLTTGDTDLELLLLSGNAGVPEANINLPVSGWALLGGYAYYEEMHKEIIFLDMQLKETNRLQLPQETQGKPVISADGGMVFHCVGQEIWVIEAEHGISRILRSHSYSSLTLLDSYFDGGLLSCRITDDQGEEQTLYLSSATGQTVHQGNDIMSLYTYQDHYYVLRNDGTTPQKILGNQSGAAWQLNITDPNTENALPLGGTLGWRVDEDKNLLLNFYETATGQKTASVTLPGVDTPLDFYADRWSGSIYLLLADGKTLLRWNIKQSPVIEETNYIGTLFTAQTPDEAGLDACSTRAKAMNKKYGISLRTWKNAVATPGSYNLQPEYQTEAINRLLDGIEAFCKEFPSKFLKNTVTNGIRICLVRSVDGETKAVQYWAGGNAYIALCDGLDLRSELLRCVGYIVDSHVLGNSSDYDYWHTCNPEGFTYGKQDVKQEYLSGETRVFADEASMQSSVEDRARIFQQAMMPENKEMFASDAMQKKLKMLCVAIRDAWREKRNTEVFPWEQYLNTPIAYNKK